MRRVLSSSMVVALLGSAVAQQPQVGARPGPEKLVRAGTMLGAKVMWHPPADGRSAPQPSPSRSEGAARAETAVPRSASEEMLATVANLVVDTVAGNVTMLTLSNGIVLPLGSSHMGTLHPVVWDAAESRFEVVSNAQPRPAPPGGAPTDSGSGTSGREPVTRMLMVDELRNHDVHVEGAEEPFGTLVDVYVRADTGDAEFVTVNRGGILGVGGTTRVVPFDRLHVDVTPERALRIEVGVTAQRLEQAPVLDKSEDIDSPQLQQRARQLFGTAEPSAESDAGDHAPRLR